MRYLGYLVGMIERFRAPPSVRRAGRSIGLPARVQSDLDVARGFAAVFSERDLEAFRAFIAANAESLWTKDACAPSVPFSAGQRVEIPALFGNTWLGPCAAAIGSPSATAQASAMDALIANAASLCKGSSAGP